MSQEIATVNQEQILLVTEETADFIRQSKASATLKAYAKQWQLFMDWSILNEVPALPASPATVANYVSELAKNHKPASIEQALASIAFFHRAKSIESPTKSELVRATMQGLKRVKGTSQKQKKAILVADLLEMVRKLDLTTKQGIFERAVLLLGFAGCFRRSELVALKGQDLSYESRGIQIALRRSKADQEGKGAIKAIYYGENAITCPVLALKAWLEVSNPASNELVFPVNSRTVARIVKRACESIGKNADDFSGHSLRAGFITQAILKGKNEIQIAKQSGHKSMAVLNRYVRTATAFEGNASNGIGL